MTTIDEIASMVTDQGKAWNASLNDVRKQMTEIEKKAGRPFAADAGSSFAPGDPERKKAFGEFLRKGNTAGLDALQAKAMQSNSDPDGGYTVIPEMDQTIDRIARQTNAMYRLANVVTTGSNKYEKLVKTSGMAMRRVADGATGGETTEPKFAKMTIEVHTAECEPWVYNETLEDSFVDLETDLAQEAGIAYAEGSGAEFITGDGVGKARGILAYPTTPNASYTWGKVGYIPSGKSAAFASVAPADALVDLVTALPIKYRNNASFLMNDTVLGKCRQMKDGSGQYYLWQADATKPFGGSLLGYPVEVDNSMPSTGAGSYSIAFGDFKSAYSIVNRTGTTLIRDPYTSKGTTKFNFRRRFSGGMINFEALKLMCFATS